MSVDLFHAMRLVGGTVETYPMPLMFTDDNWETMKKEICNTVASYAKNQ